MLALQITSMKNFMQQLLTSNTFDIFLLEQAVISTANTYTIDGHINQDFYASEETGETGRPAYELMPWSEMKGLLFDLIKGKRTPLFFKFVLHLKPDQTQALLTRNNCSQADQVKALVLTIRYDGGKAVLTTGCSYLTFVMTKEPDIIWDKTLTRYLSQKGVSYDTLS